MLRAMLVRSRSQQSECVLRFWQGGRDAGAEGTPGKPLSKSVWASAAPGRAVAQEPVQVSVVGAGRLDWSYFLPPGFGAQLNVEDKRSGYPR